MNGTYTLKGTIKQIDQTQSFGDKGFTKREFVVTDKDDKYPQDIKFEAIKERCDQLDNISVGEEVEVSFNLRGNEYNGKYYVNLQAWRVKSEGVKQEQHAPTGDGPPMNQAVPTDDDTDIPF